MGIIKLRMIWKNITFDLILHALLLFIFLSIFLFLIIVKLEREQVINSLKGQLQSFAQQLKSQVDNEALVKFGNVLLASYEEEAAETKRHNDRLRYIIIAIAVLLTVALIFLGIRWRNELDFKTLAIENTIVFILIALLEGFFFFTIVLNFEPTSSVELQRVLLQSLLKELN